MELGAFYDSLRGGWIAMAMATFIGILLWAFWPSSKAEFEKRARIPLDES